MRRARITDCDRGTSVIELALVAPILVLFIIGMSDIARAAALRYGLTKAANRAVELATSNGADNGNYDYVKTEAAAAAGVPPENVDLDYWLECDFERMPNFTDPCNSPSLPFRYVKVTINSSYTPLFPKWVFDGAIALEGMATLRVQ